MPETFAITTMTTAVPLDAQYRGSVSFTVSNTSGRPLRTHARIVPTPQAAAPWLSVQGEAERDFPVAGTQQYTVQIAVPPAAPAGNYSFRLDVVGMDNPDEELSSGPSVTFTVPASAPVAQPFPWWIVVVAAVLLLAVIGGGIFFVAQNNPACLPPPVGLVAWYPGDGTTDELIIHNNGTFHGGGSPSYAPGKVGQAFSFNGVDEFVQAPDAPQLNPGGRVTLDTWINPAMDGEIARLIDKETPGVANGYLLDLYPAGLLRFGAGAHGVNSAATLPANHWSLVAATYDGSMTRLYINGVLDSIAPASGLIPVNSLPLRLGIDQSGGNAFKGAIDEVQIFNRALSSSEIAAIYNAGSAGQCKR